MLFVRNNFSIFNPMYGVIYKTFFSYDIEKPTRRKIKTNHLKNRFVSHLLLFLAMHSVWYKMAYPSEKKERSCTYPICDFQWWLK